MPQLTRAIIEADRLEAIKKIKRREKSKYTWEFPIPLNLRGKRKEVVVVTRPQIQVYQGPFLDNPYRQCIFSAVLDREGERAYFSLLEGDQINSEEPVFLDKIKWLWATDSNKVYERILTQKQLLRLSGMNWQNPQRTITPFAARK